MNDNFENEVRRILENSSVEPPTHLWANIQAGIAPEQKRRPFIIWWLPVLVVVLLASAAGIYFGVNQGNTLNNPNNQIASASGKESISFASASTTNSSKTKEAENSEEGLIEKTSTSQLSENELGNGNGEAADLNIDNPNNRASTSSINTKNQAKASTYAGVNASSKANSGKHSSSITVKSAKKQSGASINLETNKGPVKRFLASVGKAFKSKKKVSKTQKNSDEGGVLANSETATTAKVITKPRPDDFVKEEAPTFLNDTTNYLQKQDSIEKKLAIETAALPELPAETKVQKPLFYDIYVQPRLTFSSVILQSNSELLALELLNNSSLTRRFGLDFGTRAVTFITPQWEVTYGFNFTYMKQDLSYRAEQLVKPSFQLQSQTNPMVLNGTTLTTITNRNIVNNLLLGGVNATTAIYLDRNQTLRLSAGLGYQIPLVYQMKVSENERPISNENKPRSGNGLPSFMVGGGFRTRLSSKANLILEPIATIYLRNTTSNSEPVRFKPYTIGLNAIIRFRSFKR